MKEIKRIIRDSITVKESLLANESFLFTLMKVCDLCIVAYRANRKLLFCGNGGSAADAQHLAAELVGRFRIDRPPLHAEALHTNTSYLTAASNDYGYEEAFARMVDASGREGDILFAISTSGDSENILRAAREASKKEMIVIGLTGASGGKLRAECDYLLNVPSQDTARIQEAHILIGHVICQRIEEALFS